MVDGASDPAPPLDGEQRIPSDGEHAVGNGPKKGRGGRSAKAREWKTAKHVSVSAFPTGVSVCVASSSRAL